MCFSQELQLQLAEVKLWCSTRLDSWPTSICAKFSELFSSQMIPTEQRIIVILQSKQKNLVNVEKWLNADKLSLNLEKSCQMNIKIGNSASNVNRFSVFKLNSVFITESESCKYHGVRLDFKKMKFTERIAEVKKKLAMQWGIVSKLRRYVPKSVLLIRLVFYSSNIKPIIQYGVLIYGCVSFTALQSLVLLQKKTLRLIFFVEIQGLNCSRTAYLRTS